ncbi:DUF1015 domain-containing protein [Streptomyces sp. AJS327]|uniref:DUF1015 domain-containing protein n=1 Tax=Streptomyces sp. AJS327 TaxID=2545265 RepID=UPI0015DDAE53|nr:DUF1015 domain-containing protein [Streptomyces sp. AJS327]MBA0050537.1 DUF1015 domain-containing protein [Streptomyces sp. AJS327]
MTADGLRLAPFRGLRYAPGRVSGLAAVTSPPYDVVVRPDGLRELETADPYNIVRLILPQDADPGVRHRRAAETLRRWRAEGVLVLDPAPALYVYEQRTPEGVQRGLIGALRLTPPSAGVVLPHEDVIEEVVEDRAALMRATGTQPEPLLLSYRGGGAACDAATVIEDATGRTPLLATTTEDGVAHRLWAVTDPGRITAATAALARQRALIADGHHRWATYLRLRGEHPPGEGDMTASPWDYGLVLLVDTDRYPLRVHAIHRVLPGLPLDRALDSVAGAFRTRPVPGPLPAALERLASAPGPAFLLADGTEAGGFHLLDQPSSTLLRRVDAPEGPHGPLDASVLHSALLDRVWGVPDSSSAIGYLHDARSALGQAARRGGTAVLMRPVAEQTVRDLAERGVTMPRKSTSFGPKPATGLVLRTLDTDRY